MGKSSSNSDKLTIDKDKQSDQHFDRLVLDTSYRLSKHGEPTDRNSQSSIVSSIETFEQVYKLNEDNQCQSNSIGHFSELNRLNQPKRPMNAFMVWGQAIRKELHRKFSNVQNALLSKALGRVWKMLEPEHKEPYINKANAIKANHKLEFPDYRYQPRRILERKARNGTLVGFRVKDSGIQCKKQFLNENISQFETSEGSNAQVLRNLCHSQSVYVETNSYQTDGFRSTNKFYGAEIQNPTIVTNGGAQLLDYYSYGSTVQPETSSSYSCVTNTIMSNPSVFYGHHHHHHHHNHQPQNQSQPQSQQQQTHQLQQSSVITMDSKSSTGLNTFNPYQPLGISTHQHQQSHQQSQQQLYQNQFVCYQPIDLDRLSNEESGRCNNNTVNQTTWRNNTVHQSSPDSPNFFTSTNQTITEKGSWSC